MRFVSIREERGDCVSRVDRVRVGRFQVSRRGEVGNPDPMAGYGMASRLGVGAAVAENGVR